MGVEFKSMTPEETAAAKRLLDGNALRGEELRMDPATTSFVLDEAQVTEDLINAVRSVPCHY